MKRRAFITLLGGAAVAEASEMVMSKQWLRRLHTALVVALALALVPLGTAVNAADDLHKVAVVSFGLFGDQRVFQSEATGAAQIVASRFGADPTIVKFNSKREATPRPPRLPRRCRRPQKTWMTRMAFSLSFSHRMGRPMASPSWPDGGKKRSRRRALLACSMRRTCDIGPWSYRPAIPGCSYRGLPTPIRWFGNWELADEVIMSAASSSASSAARQRGRSRRGRSSPEFSASTV